MSCQHDSDVKCNCNIGTGHKDIDAFLRECIDTMRAKGHDYRQGNDDDILHNFRTVGEAVGSDMLKVWFTYFYKHYAALVTFIKNGGQTESEPIESRIKDMIVYLLLGYQIIQEKKTKNISRLGEIFVKSVDMDMKIQRVQKLKEENSQRIRDDYTDEMNKNLSKKG